MRAGSFALFTAATGMASAMTPVGLFPVNTENMTVYFDPTVAAVNGFNVPQASMYYLALTNKYPANMPSYRCCTNACIRSQSHRQDFRGHHDRSRYASYWYRRQRNKLSCPLVPRRLHLFKHQYLRSWKRRLPASDDEKCFCSRSLSVSSPQSISTYVPVNISLTQHHPIDSRNLVPPQGRPIAIHSSSSRQLR